MSPGCAPAGFGKTSLVLQALDRPLTTAWLSLEPDDAGSTRFAHYLLAAITRAGPRLHARGRAGPGRPRRPDQRQYLGHQRLPGLRRDDTAATVAHGQAALRQLPASSTLVRSATHLMVGAGAFDSDQSALAGQELRQAIACGQAGGNPYAALTAQGVLGSLLLRQGRLDVAEQQLQAALDAQRDPGGTPLPIAGDLCVQLVANGWTIRRSSLSLAWTRFVQGDATAAHALLDALEALAPRLAPLWIAP